MRVIMLLVLVTVCMVVMSSMTVAQSADTLWTRTYWHGYWDTLNWLDETSDSGLILAGTSVQAGETEFDVKLVKTDSLGNEEWSAIIGSGEENEYAFHVLEDYDGGYLVSAQSTLTGQSGSAGGVWIVKTDALGDTLWTFPWCPGNRGSHPLHACLTADSNYAITGVENVAAGPYNQAFILILDRDGAYVDHAYYGHAYWDAGAFVHQMPDSGFIICGETDDDWWMVRTDENLALQWDSLYHTDVSSCHMRGACVVEDGIVMVGERYAAGHALKVDFDGNTLFSKSISIARTDEKYNAVCPTPDGGYMVGGWHGVVGKRRDYCFQKLTAELDTLWTFTVGGGDDDHGQSLVQTYDGNFVLGGLSSSWENGGVFWVVKIGSCCNGRVGDVNGSGDDEPTIGDVSVLIDAMFISVDPNMLTCYSEADINQSGGSEPQRADITIGDLSYLIDYLFISIGMIELPDCM